MGLDRTIKILIIASINALTAAAFLIQNGTADYIHVQNLLSESVEIGRSLRGRTIEDLRPGNLEWKSQVALKTTANGISICSMSKWKAEWLTYR